MKAVVHESAGKVTLQERREPAPRQETETLVRVIACGLCGSDLRLMADPPGMSCDDDTIIGHEMVGIVQTPGVGSAYKAGDVVVSMPNYACGKCTSCRRGLINLCDNFDHAGSNSSGGLTELVWVRDTHLFKVPDGLDPYVAALAEPLACILNGAVRASWRVGEPAVVLGAGPIGLLFLVYARLAGASPIIVSEPDEARAALARELGATYVVDPTAPGAVEEILGHTNGRGAGVVIDALGTLLDTALQVVAKAGEIFVFGVNHGRRIEITPSEIVDKELSIHGIYIANGTFPLALRLLSEHEDLFSKIVTDRVPIEDWERAREMLMEREAVGKILVTVGDPR
jgi:threonine dehydrogenase-like Zn-dependent dehydrogenase